jgi:hypothetical protein
MDPSAGNMGDPWDHPAILASIDDLCSTHFRNTKRSVPPTKPIPGSTLPPTSTNLFSRPSSPNNTGSTAQATLGGARLLDKLNKGVDSLICRTVNLMGDDLYQDKLLLKKAYTNAGKKFGSLNLDIPSSLLEWM